MKTIPVVYQSFGGCDSTVVYNIEMGQAAVGTSNVSVLTGQLVNGIPVYSDTTIVSNLTGSNGCDSIHTTNVTLINVPVTIIPAEICLGETFNGNFFTSDTTLVDTLVGASGFDSLVLTNLFVYPTFYEPYSVFLCQGGTYNGTVYQQDDSFTEELQTIHGCDSTVVTNIYVTVPQTISVDTSICAGESYLGVQYFQDTIFSEKLLSSSGCDSMIFETAITVRPAVNALITGDVELCQGETGVLTAHGGTGYQWSTGSTGNNISVNGPMDVSVTITNAYGCQAVLERSVLESNLSGDVEVFSPQCSADVTGEVNFSGISGGVEPYIYSINGGDFFSTNPEFPNLSPGAYQLIAKDLYGCTWEKSVEIDDPGTLFLDLGIDQSIKLGESISLQPQTNLLNPTTVSWSPPIGLSCIDCIETEATPLETITYKLSLSDTSGCQVEDLVRIVVDAQKKVYIPTAMSPNGDGINDVLMVYGGEDVAEVRSFVIFERWGGMIFSAENFPPNNESYGWDATWEGQLVSSGIYIWMAEVEFIDGQVKLFEGEVNLIK